MEILVGILVVLFALFVLGWVLSAMAKSQKQVIVRVPQQHVAEIIGQHFTKLWWPPVSGSGKFNFKARGFGLGGVISKRPVLSIDLETMPDGATAVQVWLSEWGTQAGIVGLADRVVLKRSSLLRKLTALDASSVTSG